MNNENELNKDNVSPYKASRNLNTAIGNPSVNINDTMNINIQNMATNSNEYQPKPPEGQTINTEGQIINNNIVNQTTTNIPQNNVVNQNNVNNTQYNNQATQNSQSVTRTYVSADNKPKKKKLALNLGSEFKVALLIIVILLVFIFILPLITDLFKSF